jgi:hypothetical protein
LQSDKDRDRAFASLAKTLVERRRWSEAQPIVDRISDPKAKAQAEAQILAEWAKSQSADQIAARLERAATREEKIALYHHMIEKLAADGSVAEAEKAIKQLVELIQNDPRPAMVSAFGRFDDVAAIATAKSYYASTAAALAQRGDRAAAAERIKWAAEPIIALDRSAGIAKMMLVMKLIQAQIAVGDLPGARNTLDQLNEPSHFMPAMLLATAYVKAGDAEAAINAARLAAENRTARGNAYGSVAAELIRGGDLGAAQRLLADLGPTADDAEAYLEAAAAMIAIGDAPGLFQWIQEMPGALQKAYACMGAAEALRKAGQ